MHALITPDKLRDCAARACLHRRVGAVTHATLGRLGRPFSSGSAARAIDQHGINVDHALLHHLVESDLFVGVARVKGVGVGVRVRRAA